VGFALGQKIDIRLKELERVMNERFAILERLNYEKVEMIVKLEERIKELEVKRGPGRPKATDGK